LQPEHVAWSIFALTLAPTDADGMGHWHANRERPADVAILLLIPLRDFVGLVFGWRVLSEHCGVARQPVSLEQGS